MPDPQIQALTVELGNLTRTMRDLVASSSKTLQAQVANQQAMLDQNEAISDFKDSLKRTTKLTKEQEKLEKEAIKAKKAELEAARKLQRAQANLQATQNKQNVSANALISAQNAAAKAAAIHRKAQGATQVALNNFNAATQTATTSLTSLAKSGTLANAALVWFGAALTAQKDQLLAQVKSNSGVIEGANSLAGALFEQQNTALKYRLAGDQFAAITNEARQMFNAMGGTSQGLKQLESTVDRLYVLTGGDAAAALEIATRGAKAFAEKGVNPTMFAMEAYTNDVVRLQKQTGLSTTAAIEFYNSINEDVDVIDQLRSARKEEREAILASQRAMLQQAIAVGMTTEQAREAAKMLNKMVAAKPLDRLKQAAKVRALSGAMGIAGGEEAAQAIIAGKRATAEQKQALMQFSQNAANAMDKMAGQGLGAEIFGTTLLEKLDLEQYYGKGSAFSTTMGDTLAKPIASVEAALKDISKDPLAKMVASLAGIYDQAKLILSGQHWLGPIAASIGVVAAYFLGGKFLGALGSAITSSMGRLSGLFGKVAPAAATTAATAAPAAAAAGGAMSKVAKVAKVAGIAGSALDVGLGVGDLMQGKAQTEMSGLDYISPMRWGMYAGDKVNKFAEDKLGGQSIGSKIYDMIHGDDVGKMLAPTPIKPKDSGAEAVKKTSQAAEELKKFAMSTADGVSQQVKKIDTSNDLLQKQTDMMEKQTELMEKQLIALTMTDKEKRDDATRSTLRRDNKFGSQYNYV